MENPFIHGCRHRVCFRFLDVIGEGAVLLHLREEGIQLLRIKRNNEKFHASVGQIAHPAADIKSRGQLFGGVTKSNALDAPAVEDLFGYHAARLAHDSVRASAAA